MVKKPTQAPQVRKAELTPDQIKSGVTKIQRRIGELQNLLECNLLKELEQEALPLKKKIEQTLSNVFGADTEEYDRYRISSLYGGGTIDMAGHKKSESEYVRHHHDGIRRAVSILQTAKSMLEEHLEDMGASPAGKARRAIDGLDLHPEIERAVGQRYRDGYYSDAILEATKALTALVKYRSAYTQDGIDLMQNVFSPSKPVLKFNDLLDESDKNEQRGFMMLFSGAVTALRNPRAHKIIKDDPEEAIEFIAFISLLAKLVDKAKKA